MAEPLTRREGATFALTLAAGFAVVSAAAGSGGHSRVALAAGAFAGASLLAAVFAPTRLRALRAAWMRAGAAIGVVTTPIVLGVIYFVVITPLGIAKRLFRGTTRLPQSYWAARSPARDAAGLYRQF